MNDYNDELFIKTVDIDFVLKSISEQADSRLTNSITTNYVRDAFIAISQVEDDEANDKEYIETISEHVNDILDDFYEISIDWDNVKSVKKMTKTVYEFFIKNYKQNLVMFLAEYICENKKEIADSIEFDGDNNVSYITAKNDYPDMDHDILKVMISPANAIRYVANSLITLDTYCEYIQKNENCDSDVSKFIKLYESDLIDTPIDIYTMMCRPILNSEDGSALVIREVTNIFMERFVL